MLSPRLTKARFQLPTHFNKNFSGATAIFYLHNFMYNINVYVYVFYCGLGLWSQSLAKDQEDAAKDRQTAWLHERPIHVSTRRKIILY